MTRLKTDKNLVGNKILADIIEIFLKDYPSFKVQQHKIIEKNRDEKQAATTRKISTNIQEDLTTRQISTTIQASPTRQISRQIPIQTEICDYVYDYLVAKILKQEKEKYSPFERRTFIGNV